MRQSPSVLMPLSGLDDADLIHLAHIPIPIGELIFELHCEISRRSLPNRDQLLSELESRLRRTRERELFVETIALSGTGGSDEWAPTIISIEDLTRQVRTGRYKKLVAQIVTHLMSYSDFQEFILGKKLSEPLTRVAVVDLCRQVLQELAKVTYPLTSHQQAIIRLMSDFVTSFEEKQARVEEEIKVEIVQADTHSISWEDAAKKVRHSTLHRDAESISELRGINDWADVSPLKLLGYSVDQRTGLPELERREFLIDFCELAILPTSLPIEYTEPWGHPATAKRYSRTAKHLGFLKRTFERQDSERFARAIDCWRRDFEFLRNRYSSKLSDSEWAAAWRGQ